MSRSPSKTAHVVAQAVNWNAGDVPIGEVTAIADDGDMIVVFSDKGAITFEHGIVASTDTTQTSWRSAAVIPAADHTGRWMVGITSDGQMYRARPEFSLESVSGRYGLEGTPISTCVTSGADHTAFGLDGAVAVTDGQLVQHYATKPYSSLAGSDGRIAMAGADRVQILDVTAQKMVTYELPGAAHVAFDEKGKLFAATSTTLYEEMGGDTLEIFYELGNGAFHGLVTSGDRVWVAAGTELGVVDGDTLALTVDLGRPENTQIVSSNSGDVWAIADGELLRFAATAIEDNGEALWRKQIGPLLTKSCNQCHLPGGPANVDLSTYASWVSHRAAINQRVVVDQNMPPPGSAPLSEADRMAIEDWIEQKL